MDNLPSQSAPADRRGGTEANDEGGRPPLVRVTVNLAPRAVEALDHAANRTKDTKTDTINRALIAYNILLDLIEQSGGRLTLQTTDGETRTVYLLL